MPDDELERLLDRIPVLAGRPRALTELTGGLTNRNVRVVTPAGDFVARIAGTNAGPPGIDRENEYRNSRAAERAGVGGVGSWCCGTACQRAGSRRRRGRDHRGLRRAGVRGR